MQKNKIIEENEEIIKIRQDFIWYYISFYLEDLSGSSAMNDSKFRLLYNQMCEYVSHKCSKGVSGDMRDFYIVAEILRNPKP